MCAMTHLWLWPYWFIWYDAFISDMTHSYVTREVDQRCPYSDVFTCMTCLVPMWHDSFICDMRNRSKVPLFWYIYMYDMSRSYVTWLVYMWHEKQIKGALILVRAMTHSHVWHVSFIRACQICDMTHSCVTWLIHVWHDAFMCDITHSCMTCLIHKSHDSFICDNTQICVTWLIYMWDMTHLYGTRLIHMWDMTHSHGAWLMHLRHDSFMCESDMAHSYETKDRQIKGVFIMVHLHVWVCAFIRDK